MNIGKYIKYSQSFIHVEFCFYPKCFFSKYFYIFSHDNLLDYEFEDDDDCVSEFRDETEVRNKMKFEEVTAYDPQAEEKEKRKQMAEIYGDANWERVLSAETSLQLNFDRFCDKELPQEWPCIPLNLKYD